METKTCKIEGCTRPAIAKRFCWMHYNRVRNGGKNMSPGFIGTIWKPDDPRRKKNLPCTVKDCIDIIYAKGLCHNHYELNRREGRLIYYKDIPKPKCSVDGCHNSATSFKSGFCRFHKERKLKNIPLNRPKGIRGSLNRHWNGGVSEYPNHYKMKKMRLIVLKEANYICEYCGKSANQIHHKDLSKDNHTRNNLVACCGSCNRKRAKIYTSKYRRIYGKTIKELADTLKVCAQTIMRWHKQGKLTAHIRQDIQYYLSAI